MALCNVPLNVYENRSISGTCAKAGTKNGH
jgi:hypothetical protein